MSFASHPVPRELGNWHCPAERCSPPTPGNGHSLVEPCTEVIRSEAQRRPVTGTSSPTPLSLMQPHTITQPPPCFKVDWMQSSLYASPVVHLTTDDDRYDTEEIEIHN